VDERVERVVGQVELLELAPRVRDRVRVGVDRLADGLA
jgi:hypothetical protein